MWLGFPLVNPHVFSPQVLPILEGPYSRFPDFGDIPPKKTLQPPGVG